MKITLTITEDRQKSAGSYYDAAKIETVTVVDIPDVEMTATLAAKMLRAVADEIAPDHAKKFAGGGIIMNPTSGALR